jgi:hypothetical protein
MGLRRPHGPLDRATPEMRHREDGSLYLESRRLGNARHCGDAWRVIARADITSAEGVSHEMQRSGGSRASALDGAVRLCLRHRAARGSELTCCRGGGATCLQGHYSWSRARRSSGLLQRLLFQVPRDVPERSDRRLGLQECMLGRLRLRLQSNLPGIAARANAAKKRRRPRGSLGAVSRSARDASTPRSITRSSRSARPGSSCGCRCGGAGTSRCGSCRCCWRCSRRRSRR